MSRGTQVPAVSLWVSGTGLSPALAELSSSFPLPTHESHMPALQPRLNESSRFGLIPFRSPLLWESRLISFPSGTEMFHFPELALDTLCIQVPATEHDLRRVSPFRNPRITECLASPRNFLPSLFNCKRAITFVMAGSYPVRTRNLLRFLSEMIRSMIVWWR